MLSSPRQQVSGALLVDGHSHMLDWTKEQGEPGLREDMEFSLGRTESEERVVAQREMSRRTQEWSP